MTDLEELHRELEDLAARGEIRPSQDVLDAARRFLPAERRRRPVVVIVSIAAAFVLVAALAGWYLASSDDPVSVTTGSEPELPDRLIDSLTVPAVGEVQHVTVAFGRIWVASGWPPATTIRAFDASTGELVGTVESPGPYSPDLVGDVISMVASDHSLWVRTTTSGPAIPEYGGADNVIYQVEPTTLAALPVRFLNGDGPLAAHGDRIVAATFSHLEIMSGDASEIATRTIDQVIGIEGATVPGTNGISHIHLDGNGLWVVHDGRRLVARLDPEHSGETISVGELGDDGGGTPVGRSVWWATALHFSGRPPLAVGLVLDDPGAKALNVEIPVGLNVVGSIDSGHFLVDNPVGVVDVATGRVTPPDPTGTRADVVSIGGSPRVAVWSPGEGDHTVITFQRIPS